MSDMRLGTDFHIRTAHHTTKPASPGRVSDRTNDVQTVLLVAAVYVACAAVAVRGAASASPDSGDHASPAIGGAACRDRT